MKFVKAVRSRKKLRLALAGPSGAGKTLSALLAAHGIGSRIAVIDTEHASASMYADDPDLQLEFDTLVLDPPYTPSRYVEAIKQAGKDGYEVVVIDSLSHAWAGEGGALEMHDAATAASKAKNSYMAWREVTPMHNALVGAILASPCHVIATIRSKVEYAQTDDKKVVKLGMEMIQRQGMDYEFDMVLDLENSKHLATPSKTRIKMFDGQHFLITRDTGKQLADWLNSGAAIAPSETAPASETASVPAASVPKTSTTVPKPSTTTPATIDFTKIPDLAKYGITIPCVGLPLIGTSADELIGCLEGFVALSKRSDLGAAVCDRAGAWAAKIQEVLQARLAAEKTTVDMFGK